MKNKIKYSFAEKLLHITNCINSCETIPQIKGCINMTGFVEPIDESEVFMLHDVRQLAINKAKAILKA